ncbi:alanine--tRNA ligase [archaeon]|nr:alanine--tRNA ligase [archaeon]
MLSKDDLRAQFAKDWKKYYDAGLGERDFERRSCDSCKKNFWTLDAERKRCGDPPCTEYEFIDKPVTRKRMDYVGAWKAFEKYFTSQGHELVPRYPVICRWREDLYFTIASIVDFQRLQDGRITFEYPSDKLIVPQACLRFGDIPNVGVTGRHLTSFIMGGQHAFGHPRTGYWKKECIDYNFEFLTKVCGIKPERLTYIEDVWAMPDFSMFGSCLESFVGGLETANSVFSEFTATGNGFGLLDLKVIDVGWGHERLVWLLNSTPTMYDSAFGPVIEKMKKKAGVKVDKDVFSRFARISGSLNIDETPNVKTAWMQVAAKLHVDSGKLRESIEPLQALYAVCDHARTLAFAIADGGMPSNAGGGYNLRVILRRALSFIDEYELGVDIEDVIREHARYLKPLFPELKASLPAAERILGVEREKFKDSALKSRKLVSQFLQKGASFDNKALTMLYESHGVTPELINEVARQEKRKVEVPGDFYTSMTSRHEKVEPKQVFAPDVTGLPRTRLLYYDHPRMFEFTARIVKAFAHDNKKYAVLEQTAFYPEGGGQQCDLGFIAGRRVLHVSKVSGVVLHQLDDISTLSKNMLAHGEVDRLRRNRLMRHHTAVHIVNGAVHKVLGAHSWQSGAEKTPEKARLDVTHYELPSRWQVEQIQKLANEVVKKHTKVTVTEMDRHEAEKHYGFSLYQGGIAPGSLVRVVDVGGFDTECCGGTHCHNASEVEVIRITNVRKVQDGVIRFELVAGNDLVSLFAKEEEDKKRKELELWEKKVSDVRSQIASLSVDSERRAGPKRRAHSKSGVTLPLRLDSLISLWKKESKQLEKLRKQRAISLVDEPVQLVDRADMKVLEELGAKLADENGFCVLIGNGIVFAKRNARSQVDVSELAKLAAGEMGGSAGGKDNEFKGGGPFRDKARAAYDAVLARLGEQQGSGKKLKTKGKNK